MTPDDHDETPPPEGDLEIVHLIRERDGRGLRLLLQRHGGNVEAVLRVWFRGHLKNTDIEDVVSTASYRVWQSIQSYAPEKGPFRAWFLLICKNVGRDLLRQRGKLPLQKFDEDVELRVARQDRQPTRQPSRLLDALLDCIAALPKLQKSVIEADLRCDGTACAAELAKKLKTTPNSIYVTRSNARKALRHALARRGFQFDSTSAEGGPQPSPESTPAPKPGRRK